METEQELNKKLLKFAGFKFSHTAKARNFFTGELGRKVEFWQYPNGQCSEPPNFPQDETACFKWLVPKLKGDVNIIYVTRPYDKPEGFSCAIHDYEHNKPPIFAETETPALALCKAIEKLIDSEVK